MKTQMTGKRYFLIFFFIILLYQCRTGEAGPKSSASNSKENENTILSINNEIFYAAADLRNFFLFKYPTGLNITESDRFLTIIFEQFIEQKLIVYLCSRDGISISDDEVDIYLKSQGLDPDQTQIKRVLIRENLLVQKYLTDVIYTDLTVEDEAVNVYYNNNREDYRKKEQVFLHQILVKEKDLAIRIHSILKDSPERFEELARQESVATEANKNGVLGFFEKGTLPEEIESYVFSLKVDSVSPVVESPYGFHIFKVTEKVAGDRLLYLSQVKDEIINKLLSSKMENAYQELLGRMRTELNIRTYIDRIDPDILSIDKSGE